MNDIFFAKSFVFLNISFEKYSYTDNKKGAPYHYFAYLRKGRCKITTEKYTVEINEGDIFFIPYKCPYQSYWYGEPEIKFVSLGFLYLPNFDGKVYPVQTLKADKKRLNIIEKLSKASSITAREVGLFYTLVGDLMPEMQFTTVGRTEEIVDDTRRYLNEHPFATTAELAKNCAISESALYSAFQKSSEITPNRLRNRILLEKSRELLLTTDLPIEQVSDTMGFSSTSYFRKKFKQHFGITPREMRKKSII